MKNQEPENIIIHDIRGQICPSCLLFTLREVNEQRSALKNWVGVLPVFALKCLLKVDLVPKPQSYAKEIMVYFLFSGSEANLMNSLIRIAFI